MNRVGVVIILLLISSWIPGKVWAENQNPRLQILSQHIKERPVSIEPSLLEESAVLAYQVLLNIPFVGIQSSQRDVQGLIALKNALIAHTGLVERLFALRMQEAIDCALLSELNRKTMAFRGEAVNPPYKEEPLTDETVLTLLGQNAMSEAEHAQYILAFQGIFAQICQQNHLEASDLLNGKAFKTFPSDLQKQYWQILSYFRSIHDGMDRQTMQDFVFAYTLFLIDQARDVRTLSEVFLADPSFSLSMIDTRKIDKVLDLYPDRYRVSSGMKNSGRWIFPVGSYCCARPKSDDYPILLTDLFDPYFGDIEAIAAQYDGIFSWYHESGAKALSEFKTGMWLELKE